MRKRSKPVLCLIVSLLFCVSDAHSERLPIKSYTSADGLGSSFVNYLMRDSRGFMWFCTRDGLSRFDGARFVTYRIGDKMAPPGIEAITETRDAYWITTTGGLYRFKPDAVSQSNAADATRPTLNAEFVGSHRGTLLEDRKGNLWYGSDSLYLLEEKDGRVLFKENALKLPLPANSGVGIGRMSEAADGSLWLDTSHGLVRRLPDGRLIFYAAKIVPSEENRSLLLDGDGRVWYARGLEFYVLRPEPLESLADTGRLTVRTLKPTYVLTAVTDGEIRLPEKAGEILGFRAGDLLTRYPVRWITQTSNKHVWVTIGRHLLEFDGRVFHRFSAAQGLPPTMAAMAEDSAGNLWIGGQTVLIRLDRRGLTSYGEADGLHSAAIHVINEAKDGTLYFADGDFYLTRYDGKHFQTLRPGIESGPKMLWTSRYAFLDSRNEWWILTDARLYRFAGSDLQRPLATYTSRDGLKSNLVFQIFEDKIGGIWVSVRTNDENSGLARLERSENRFHTFSEADGLPAGKAPSSFAEDHNGAGWFGFYEGGITRYANHRFVEFTAADGLPEGTITDLHVDRAGRLWLASSMGGVSRVDDPGAEKPGFVSLTTNDGLSSNNIRTITEDPFGNIYLGTVRGVDRISPETKRIRHYSINDGLAADFVMDSHCDKDGVLWFATTGGLSRLTSEADENHVRPPIWLGGMRIAGVPQAIPALGANEIGTFELLHTQNTLQLDFFGLDFQAGETLRYQYRLEGADSDWSAPTEDRTVTFANLRPGTYRFVVRALDAHGAASEKPAIVSFKILSPIWQRWWFLGLAGVLVAAIAFAIASQRAARRREREGADAALRQAKEDRLRDLEQVRSHIAADLHDDIGSNLTRISLISEVAQRRLNGADTPVGEQLSSIGKLSRELVDSMSEIVWAINPNKDHFADLSQRMRHFASDLLTNRQIQVRFTAVDFDRDIRVGANVRREFFLVFKEAVNNIARHSACTRVEIDLHAEGDDLILTLSDDGKGFDANQKSDGHGLGSMRGRTLSLGGDLEIKSAAGQGTKLRFAIPLQSKARDLR
jgi:signal transduction histidine kinase/ligand-binding sensor domain-containing protein